MTLNSQKLVQKNDEISKNGQMEGIHLFHDASFDTHHVKLKMKNERKMNVRFKCYMFFIITPFMEELIRRIKMFWIDNM